METVYKFDPRKLPEFMPAPGEGLTSGTMSKHVRQMVWHSLRQIDGVRYMKWLAVHRPELYVQLLAKALIKDDESAVGGLTITVQQIVSAPQPVPGVLASPIAGNIAPQLKLVERDEGEDADAA